jgi:hypothetical protein
MLICTTFDLDQRLSLHCTYSLIQHWIYLTGQRWNRKARSQPTGRNGLGASSPQGGFDSGCKPSRYGSSRARSVHCGFALPVGHARSKFGRIKACGTSVGQRGAKSVTRASQSGQGGRTLEPGGAVQFGRQVWSSAMRRIGSGSTKRRANLGFEHGKSCALL